MPGLTEKLAGDVPTWGAKLAYGSKTTVGGVELLPVAVVTFGFGAGELAESEGQTPNGEGGGGGGLSFPIGVYVGEEGEARFKPNALVLGLVAAPVIAAIGIAVSSIVLAARKW